MGRSKPGVGVGLGSMPIAAPRRALGALNAFLEATLRPDPRHFPVASQSEGCPGAPWGYRRSPGWEADRRGRACSLIRTVPSAAWSEGRASSIFLTVPTTREGRRVWNGTYVPSGARSEVRTVRSERTFLPLRVGTSERICTYSNVLNVRYGDGGFIRGEGTAVRLSRRWTRKKTATRRTENRAKWNAVPSETYRGKFWMVQACRKRTV
jgi:hypothetical protein